MGQSQFLSGTMWSLASAFLWATTFICARYLLADGRVDPVTLSMLRFTIGGAVLLGYGLIAARLRVLGIALRDVLPLALLGLFGVVGMSVLLFFGQQTTTAINSSLIMQSNPVMVALLGLLIGERLNVLQGLGVIMSLFGCLLVVKVISADGFGYDPAHIAGDLFVAASALSWAIYTVAGKKVVRRLGGMVTATWAMVFGAIELVVLWILLDRMEVIEIIWPGGNGSEGDWLVIVYLAVLPTAVAFLAWYKAMNRIPLALLNVMQYLTPGFTILLGWLLLNESMDLLTTSGLILILTGVVMAGVKKIGNSDKFCC